MTGSAHNGLVYYSSGEKGGHYHEIHVQSSSLSQDGEWREGWISDCFQWQSFHFLLSDKQ